MPTRVEDLLRRKGGVVHSVADTATVYQAIELMAAEHIGSVMVKKGSKVAGIFTERDYLRRIVLEGRTSRDTQVRDVMTENLVTVTPGESIEDCMAHMTGRRFRHLPVMDGDDLVGILSIGDIVKENLRDAQARAEHLEQMVSGNYPT